MGGNESTPWPLAPTFAQVPEFIESFNRMKQVLASRSQTTVSPKEGPTESPKFDDTEIVTKFEIRTMHKIVGDMIGSVESSVNNGTIDISEFRPEVYEGTDIYRAEAVDKINKKSLLKVLGINERDYDFFENMSTERIHLLDWRNLPVDSVFYRVAGLIQHDAQHLIADPKSSIFEIYAIGPSEEDMYTKKDFIGDLKALGGLLGILQKAEGSKHNDIPLSDKDLMSTLNIPGYVSIEIEGKSGEHLFSGIEEFISVRTLIINAIKARATKIRVVYDDLEGDYPDKMHYFSVLDNSLADKDIWGRYIGNVREMFEVGQDFPEVPGDITTRGGGIAAFLAGQRSGLYEYRHNYYDARLLWLKTINPTRENGEHGISLLFPSKPLYVEY